MFIDLFTYWFLMKPLSNPKRVFKISCGKNAIEKKYILSKSYQSDETD